MSRCKIYFSLITIIWAMAAVLSFSDRGNTVVIAGESQGEYPEEWNRIISDKINQGNIRWIVDGKEQKHSGKPYLTSGMSIMLPVDALSKAFSCAVNFYDNSKLIIQKNTISIEIRLEEKNMMVNGIMMEMSEPFVKMENGLYIPSDAIEKGLSYSNEWSSADSSLNMTAQQEISMLPYSYDYRREGRVPKVKNQGSLGTCWAFASLMAMETVLMPEEKWDFSEEHMSIQNSFGLTQNEGGEYTMSMAYLLAWQGPVRETEDQYDDGFSPAGIKPSKHVQEIQILPSKDYEKIKEAVYLYGGVQSSLYTSLKNYRSRSVYYNREKSAYCYIGTEKPNHDVVIVGWDDNYPKENFNMDLEGNGAFICVNSWGESFGEDGYFYISYYDTNIGIHNILYSGIEPVNNYDKIYQSDLCGWVGQLGYGIETAYFAEIYTAEEAEQLEAAGFYATGPGTEYEIFVSHDAEDSDRFENRELCASGKLTNTGFYTIKFDNAVKLRAGERFGIIVKIRTPGSIHPVAIEYDAEDSRTKVDLSDGEGYISLRGTVWENVESEQKCNLCLKAYTVRL